MKSCVTLVFAPARGCRLSTSGKRSDLFDTMRRVLNTAVAFHSHSSRLPRTYLTGSRNLHSVCPAVAHQSRRLALVVALHICDLKNSASSFECGFSQSFTQGFS